MTDTPPAAATAAPPRRRRWPRVLLVLVVLGVGLLLAGPWLAAPLVERLLVGNLEDNLEAEVQVDDVSLRHGAGFALRGLRLHERVAPGGAADPSRPLARVEALDARVDLWGLLTGRADLGLTLQGFELHLRRDADGRTNLERVIKARAPKPDTDPSGPMHVDDLPRVRAQVDVRGGRVVVHADDGVTELRDITVRVDIDGLDAPAPWSLSAQLHGPQGAAGGLTLSGEVRLDEWLQPADARLEWSLDDLALSALSPALQMLADVRVDGGRLTGRGRYDVQPGALSLSGTSALSLSGLVLAGPALGEAPLAVPDLRLDADGDVGAAGTEGHDLHLSLGDALVVDGRLGPLTLAEGGRLSLQVKAQLDRLTELLRPWVPLQTGHALGGTLTARADVGLAMASPSASGRAPGPGGLPPLSGLDLDGRIELADLSARDAEGRALPLGELTEVLAEAGLGLAWDADGAGTLTLRTLGLDAGPVQVTGRGSLAGLPAPDGRALDLAALRPGESHFTLAADLDRLAAALSPLLGQAAGTWTLGGRLDAELSVAAGVGDGLPGDTTVRWRVEGVRAADGQGLELQVGSLTGEQLWDAGAAVPGLTGRLDLAALRVADGAGLRVDVGSLAVEDTLALDGDRARVDGRVVLTGLRAELPDRPTPVEVPELAAALGAALDTLGGGLELSSWSADLPFGRVAGTGRAQLDPETWQLATGADTAELRAEWRVMPADLGAFAAPFMAGLGLAGTPTLGNLQVTRRADGWRLVGDVESKRLKLTLPPGGEAGAAAGAAGAPIELVQKDVLLAFDLWGDPAEALHVERLQFGTATANGRVTGLLGLADPDATRLDLALDGELPVLLDDLAPLLALPVKDPRGVLAVRHEVQHRGGRWVLAGATTIDGFGLTLPSPTPGAPDLVLSDPQVRLDLSADVGVDDPDAVDVEVTRLGVDSSLLSGELSGGLTLAGGAVEARAFGGRFEYVPERLGALLAPLLPVSWQGAEAQELAFTLDGRLDPADLAGSLPTVRLQADAGTGSLVSTFGEVSGRVDLDLAEGRGQLLTSLDVVSVPPKSTGSQAPAAGGKPAAGAGGTPAAPGRVTLRVDLDTRDTPDAVTTLALDITDVDARAETAQLVAGLHPLFMSAVGEGGLVKALVGGRFELTVGAPLASFADALSRGDPSAVPLQALTGRGEVSISQALIRSSPLASEILGKLGLPVTEEASLDTLVFELKQGRVHYAEPWDWTLAGHATEWSGSVGLDKTLDLAWSLPITAELVAKYDKLAPLQGEPLTVKVTGRLDAPRLGWNDALSGLLERALEKRVDSVTEPLDVLLGKGKEDPNVLLSQADALWNQGKRDEARPIYRKLATTYKLTITYALHKKRIEERAED